jgi:Na+-driven multidrug efflux pump
VLSLFLGANDASIDIGRHINVIACWSFVLLGVTFVLSAVPRANGATWLPLVIMTLALIPGRLGAAFLLLDRIGADALWWSFPIGSAVATSLTFAYYLWGGWRKLTLLAAPSVDEAEEFLETEAEPAGRVHPAG